MEGGEFAIEVDLFTLAVVVEGEGGGEDFFYDVVSVKGQAGFEFYGGFELDDDSVGDSVAHVPSCSVDFVDDLPCQPF